MAGPVVPTVPFWKSIAIKATMARRPLAISELSLPFRAAGSAMLAGSKLKMKFLPMPRKP